MVKLEITLKEARVIIRGDTYYAKDDIKAVAEEMGLKAKFTGIEWVVETTSYEQSKEFVSRLDKKIGGKMHINVTDLVYTRQYIDRGGDVPPHVAETIKITADKMIRSRGYMMLQDFLDEIRVKFSSYKTDQVHKYALEVVDVKEGKYGGKIVVRKKK